MRRALLAVTHAVAAVLLAHALAFGMVKALPDAAVIALGFESANPLAVAAFRAAQQERSYIATLTGLLSLDFGVSLDGVAVRSELKRSLSNSAPRFALAYLLTLGAMFALPALLPSTSPLTAGALPLLAFLPPYVAPLLALGLITAATLLLGWAPNDWIRELILVLALAAPVTSLALKQAGGVMARLLTTDHARTLSAIGASSRQQRWLLMPNVVSEMLPSLQKLAVAMLGILLFVEPIFGAAGIGTTALRAIRRSDVDLLLGVVTVFALATITIGLAGQALQAGMHRTVR